MDKIEKYRNAYGKETLVEWNIEVMAKKINELVEGYNGLTISWNEIYKIVKESNASKTD